MLIFEFNTETRAEAFAEKCRQCGKDAYVWPNQDAMEEAFHRMVDGKWSPAPGSDMIPAEIIGLVVTVERDDDIDIETSFINLAGEYKGQWVGT